MEIDHSRIDPVRSSHGEIENHVIDEFLAGRLSRREFLRRGSIVGISIPALGLHCIAAPVGRPGQVLAAITLCVPSGRMTTERRAKMIPDLLAAARDVTPPLADELADRDHESIARGRNP